MQITNCKSRGFTLIELLAVIAIISVLVSILLPSLNRAKKLAMRVTCGSNLHGVNMAYGLYASGYKRCVPVGYFGCKQINYRIYQKGRVADQGFLIFGYLYLADMIPDPKAFDCPTCPIINYTAWPPGGGATETVNAGYGCRPAQGAYWGTTTQERVPNPFPHLYDLHSKAIVADIASKPLHVDQRHVNGVNVGYLDGSVHWINRDLFNEHIEDLGAYVSGANNIHIEHMWDVFDEQY